MFGRDSPSRPRETASRVLSSLLSTTGLVCGSIKDTIDDNTKQMDMKWIGNEIDYIRNKMEEPRERMLNLAEKACKGGGDYPLSPDSGGGGGGDGRESGGGHYFDDENSQMTNSLMGDDTGTAASTSVQSRDVSPKRGSRFAAVHNDVKKQQQQQQQQQRQSTAGKESGGSHNLVIGLCLSRRDPILGHPDTVTRQTAFDFNELQDRDCKFVSSTDDSGWLAGGGEMGGNNNSNTCAPLEFESDSIAPSKSEDSEAQNVKSSQKIAAPDKVHIPIIQIQASSSAVVEEIISALARGEIFIPHVSILPEGLSVNGSSPPDLVVRFDCEKNDDSNPEEWPNWCLEFLHNQLYDYFAPMGAQWTKRPFQITLARKVRWKTAKHMNMYFSHSEEVINTWREQGPQFLQPPSSKDSLGVTKEELSKPHGIYLLRNGIPTNYFAPNFEPPYTTKMTRSLIKNVVNKSWDAKHRDWRMEAVPRMRGPAKFISTVMGCGNPDPAALSPMEDKSGNIFHMAPDFESFDEKLRDERHSNGDAHQNGGQRKETIESQPPVDSLLNVTYSNQNKSDKEAHIPSRISSDESYGNSTKPSIEETVSDGISANRTQSSVESPASSRQWSDDGRSREEQSGKRFFHQVSESQGASKGVSFNDTLASEDNDGDWKYLRLEPEGNRAVEKERANGLAYDSKAEKFAKTKV